MENFVDMANRQCAEIDKQYKLILATISAIKAHLPPGVSGNEVAHQLSELEQQAERNFRDANALRDLANTLDSINDNMTLLSHRFSNLSGPAFFKSMWTQFIAPSSSVAVMHERYSGYWEHSALQFSNAAKTLHTSANRALSAISGLPPQFRSRLISIIETTQSLVDAPMIPLMDIEECHELHKQISTIVHAGGTFVGGLSVLRDMSDAIVAATNDSLFKMHMASFWETHDRWKNEVLALSTGSIGALKEIFHEYMIWLQQHPDAVREMHHEAFEKMVGEVLAQQGYRVKHVGRERSSRSDPPGRPTCDLYLIDHGVAGETRKYIVECKKQKNKVDLGIVHGVHGAYRAAQGSLDLNGCFLVTSSTFTSGASKEYGTPNFRTLDLFLEDFDTVGRWLGDYSPRKTGGIWLSDAWDESCESAFDWRKNTAP